MTHPEKAGGRKQFFCQKKNQKTFANRASLYPGGPQPKESKAFCFFFSKNKVFLPFLAAGLRHVG
jgi:hypothetical protein